MKSAIAVRAQALFRIVGVLLLGFVLAALGIAVSGLAARPRPADAALVFGNTVERSGQPSRRLAARLDAARGLFERKTVRLILVSGGVGKEGFDEARVMARVLRERGVPDSAILVDSRGVNTLASCLDAPALLAAHHASSVDLVTQYFHIARARLAGKRAGLDVKGAVAPLYFEPRDFFSLAREVVALPVYALRRSHP
jgi:vancomycin permeability regulator SanA